MDELKTHALSVKQQIILSVFWWGSNVMWGSLLAITIPEQVADLVGPLLRAPKLGELRGIGALISFLLPLIIGGLSDRCLSPLGRRKPFIILGTFINILGLLGMHFTHQLGSFWFYVCAYVLVAFGNNVATSAYSGIIPDLVPENQRGSASGYMGFMSQFGTMLGVVLSSLLPHSFVPVITISALLIALVVTFFGVKETPIKEADPLHWPTYLKSLWISPKQYPDFAWVWITRFLVMMGFYAVQPFWLYYLQDVIRVEDPKVTTAQLLGTVGVFAMISGLFAGKISDRIGKKKVVYVCNTIIALLGIVLIFCREIWEVLCVGVLFGSAYGAYISVDWALGTDVLPTKTNAAKEMAVWHIAMTIPQAIGDPIAGHMIASFGMTQIGDKVAYTQMGYTAMLTFMSLCFALGAIGLRQVKKST